MNEPATISIRFRSGLDAAVRRRIEYAYRVFCACYGLRDAAESGSVRLCYGLESERPGDVCLPEGYRARPPAEPAPAPTLLQPQAPAPPGSPEAPYPAFHAVTGGEPDWLGEAFEWISAAHEQSVDRTDEVGRTPDDCTLGGRFDLDDRIPYAAVAFQRLNARIASAAGDGWPRSPACPFGSKPGSLSLVCTHDIDFLPVGLHDVVRRVLKNAGIALAYHREPFWAARLLGRALREAASGRMPMDYLPRMLQREADLGIGSTCNIICRRGHRRDANYALEQARTRALIQPLVRARVELGVHGSYQSLESPGGLGLEYDALERFAGSRPAGGRQHWLRFRGTRLFAELERCGAAYDCTVGFGRRAGYRTGACFPYPPYDFKEERPFTVLEFPLALMDVALYSWTRDPERAWNRCREVIERGRAFGWGGMSLLWHDTVLSGLQIPPEHAEIFWRLKQPQDRWMSGAEMVGPMRARFAAAGLAIQGSGSRSLEEAAS